MRRADVRRAPLSARAFAAVLVALALAGGCVTPSQPTDAADAGGGGGGGSSADVALDGAGDESAEAGADESAEEAADESAEVDADPGESAPPVPFVPPDPPPGRDALVAHAGALVAGALANAEDGQIAVLVVDEHGRELVAHEPDTPVLPASTLKVVTAAAVLTTLGASGRLTTRVESTAPIDADGAIEGDLVLVGGGDPVLATAEYGRWVYPARPRTPLETLADAVVEAGVRTINGDVVGVATAFTGPHRAQGWPDRYFSDFDARYGDLLTIDGGLRTLVTYPEPEEDDDADDDVDDDVEPSESDDADPPVEPAADGDDDTEDLGPPTVRVEHVEQPAIHAASELVRLLAERDVEVAGEARSGEPAGRIVGRLASVESPPLDELLRFAVQRSDNQLTDGLFLAMARARTGVASWEQGDRAVRQVLDRFGIDHTGARFADGSGLSRDDRVTVRMLVELDRAMLASRHGTTWKSLMAVMGESGTLERRLRGTPAQGRFFGKTGTLRDVSALSGSVVGDAGGRYHLAVVANAAGQARWISRALVDELILLLVADLEGCAVGDAGEDDGPLGRPPLAIAC